VTPAASVSFFRPEFDDFLYAPIGTDKNEMPLSVLSALARLDIDPWGVAAELSELPKEIATQKLASLIARLPGGQWTQADLRGIAHRLIELLPRPSRPKVPLTVTAHGLPKMRGSLKIVIFAALGGIALITAASCEPSSGADIADAPAFNTVAPPQMSPPSSLK
jgi:hypothetical protein